MSAVHSSFSRRRFLAAGSIAAADFLLAGCCHHGMSIFKSGTLSTAPGVPVNSPLTIDVHCHIFNGTDLQIRTFLGNVEYPTWWGKAAGEILQLVNWDLLPAPTGEEEKAKLEKLWTSAGLDVSPDFILRRHDQASGTENGRRSR